MTFSQIITESRRLVKANESSLPISDIVQSANNALERVVALIRDAQGRWQWDDRNNTEDLPFATTGIADGVGDITLDPSHYQIDKVEMLDAGGGWATLIPFDVSDPRCAAYSTLVGTSGVPVMYDKVGESLILAPKPNFTRAAALKVSYERGPSYFTSEDTTKTPGFNPLFHKLIPFWVAYDHAVINQLPISKQLGVGSKKYNTLGLIPDMEEQLKSFYMLRGRDEHIRLTSGTRRQSFR